MTEEKVSKKEQRQLGAKRREVSKAKKEAREAESKAHRRKVTMPVTEKVAQATADNLTEVYSKKVVVASFKGFPVVMFKDRVYDENGNVKPISNYP